MTLTDFGWTSEFSSHRCTKNGEGCSSSHSISPIKSNFTLNILSMVLPSSIFLSKHNIPTLKVKRNQWNTVILTFIWMWHSLLSQIVSHSTASWKAQCLSLKLWGAAHRCPVQGDLTARWRFSARRGSLWRSIRRACGESRVWRSCRAACVRRGSPDSWPQRRARTASPPCAAGQPRSPASASPSRSHTAHTAASSDAVWTKAPQSLVKVNDSR